MSQMHEDDAHDDDLIAMETSNQIHTRAQLSAAENAAVFNDLAPDVRNDAPALPVS